MKYYLSILTLLITLVVNSAPTLVKPNDDFVTINKTIIFSWDEIDSSDFYHLELSTSSDFSTFTLHTVSNNDTILNLSLGNYYWRINSYIGGDGSVYSETRTFSIIDINNLSSSSVAWYNSDSTIILDGSNKISEWRDVSGSNNHANQLNPAVRTTKIINSPQLNNKSTVSFNGSGYLNTPYLNIQNTEVFLISKGNNTDNKILGFGGGFWVNRNSNGPLIILTGGNFRYFNPFQTTGNFQIQHFGFQNGDAAANTTFLNINKSILNYGPSTSGVGFQIENLDIGATGGFNGEIAEIIVFNDYLTTEEREQVSNYLRHKYAPPVNLGLNISQYGFCDTTLYAGKRFESFLWSDGSIADSLIVTEPGTYFVETVDIFGFTSSDTIEVTFSEPDYPITQLYCKDSIIDWQTGLGEHYNYLWSDGSAADSLVINSPGNYHVVVTDTNGCVFKSDTLSISEDSFTTTMSLGPDTNLCTGNNLGLSVGAGETTDYLWSTGETTPTIPMNSSGTYSVIAENANGCIAKDTIEVTIIGDAPNISMDIPNYVCTAAPFDYEDLSTTTDGSNIISWNWDFDDGSSATTAQGTSQYAAAGMYDVSLTIETSSGCFNKLTRPIEVKENPVLTFTSNFTCQNQAITFNGGQLSPQTITDWNWNFDDPTSGVNNISNGQNTAHTFDASGDYDIMLIGTDIFGCIDTLIQSKTIAATPSVDFTFTEVCEGNVVNYQNTSSIASPGTITTYQWNFGDGTNSGQTNPQKPYASQGSYTVGLNATANNGCTSSLSQTVKIHAIPQVNYSLTQACAGIETQFIDNSFIPNGSVAQVDWTINGQATLTGFTVTNNFTNSGTYSLEQTVKSAFGCMNSASSTISIKDFIEAGFIFSPNAFVTGYPIVFESTGTGANEYNWTFGDFATSQQADTNILFNENQIGETYEVELWVRNIHGCTDSMSIQRTVMERHTDLEVSQLFSQEMNGYLTLGVQLKNLGTTPITKVDLFLRKPGMGAIKESWAGNLQAGQTEIYIFSASPSSTVPAADTAQNYICIEGRIVAPAQFVETDLSNNEVCKVIAPTEAVLIRPYPNPVTDQLSIKVVMPTKSVLALHVYDDQGRLIHTITDKEELSKGLNTFHVNTSSWAAGNYKIRTVGSDALGSSVPSVGFVKL